MTTEGVEQKRGVKMKFHFKIGYALTSSPFSFQNQHPASIWRFDNKNNFKAILFWRALHSHSIFKTVFVCCCSLHFLQSLWNTTAYTAPVDPINIRRVVHSKCDQTNVLLFLSLYLCVCLLSNVWCDSTMAEGEKFSTHQSLGEETTTRGEMQTLRMRMEDEGRNKTNNKIISTKEQKHHFALNSNPKPK